ncbi:alginate export family protein [Pseudomonas massiliensis]|uniref:alginate export family protein n=1 Tax=Pseudomonas massiliensis TaxID=522492 RepID=UPI00058FF3A8|nr:alginate export family protein [Pseudomonas massiliensis]
MKQWVTAGVGLGCSLVCALPALAAQPDGTRFGLEIKATAQSEGDRDLGTAAHGDVNGFGLDLRPWAAFQRGAWSGYVQAQAVTATDIVETDTLQQNTSESTSSRSNDRQADKSYLALREFWVGYRGLTPYPGELLKFGRQRLRNDDGQWRDTNIEALAWTFDTTLLKANLGTAQRFSDYRTDLSELAPTDKDRLHLFGDAAWQWQPGQWIGVRAHHSRDNGSLDYAAVGRASDPLDKTENGDLTWFGLDASSEAYRTRGNTNTLNYWASVTGMKGTREKVNSLDSNGNLPSERSSSDHLNGWATDLGLRLRLDPSWQVGAAYARASGDYEQNGLQSNRSTFTGTTSRVHRFGEAFRGDFSNIQSATLFGSWNLREDYDASLVYHRFWRVDGDKAITSRGVTAYDNDYDDATGALLSSSSLPLRDGEKDLGQEMDLVVTRYFKQGLLPAGLSQSLDEPSALVRLRGGVFKPGDAYGSQVDSYMHRAFVDVIWRY